MAKKFVPAVILTLLLTSLIIGGFEIHPVIGVPGIRILADGSVDPPSAPILNVGNVNYTFMANIYDGILIERSNIVLNGAGFLLGGELTLYLTSNVIVKDIIAVGNGEIHLLDSSGNTICENTFTNSPLWSIYLESSSGNRISNNTIISTGGILLNYLSSGNRIFSNTITNNSPQGIEVSSDGNIIFANTITGCSYYGIDLVSCSNNICCANTLTNNSDGIYIEYYASGNSILSNTIANNSNCGISLEASSGNTISANNITNDQVGIALNYCSENSISANYITKNVVEGIILGNCANNSIFTNSITSNGDGIWLAYSSNNQIYANNSTNNKYYGIFVNSASNNFIWHNTFFGNATGAIVYPFGYANVWDDGYPSGGNYWDDYHGVDFYKGPDQNVFGSDGIGDTPYVIDANNTDRFPLMGPWNSTLSVEEVTSWFWASNTTINTVVVDDVDGDGQKETVTGGTFYDGSRNVAILIVWNSSSLMPKQLTSWYWLGNTTINSVAVGDVNGDGQSEIVTGGSYFDGTRNVAQLVVWNGSSLDAEKIQAWYWTGNTVINSVALGDVDGDGQVDIVTGGYYNDGARNIAQLVVWNGSSLAFDRFTSWYWAGNTVINSVALGDVDGDGHVEIVTGGFYFDGTRKVAQLVEWSGLNLAVDRLTGWYWTDNTVINSVAVGDLYNDGQTEIVTGGNYFDGTRNVALLVVWNGSSLAVDRLTVWYWTGNTVINSVALGDVNRDGQLEVVTGGSYFDGIRNNAQLVVWSGSNLAVESIRTWYWTGDTVVNSVATGDINGDFSAEIIAGGTYYDGTRSNAQLTVWGMT